MNTDKQAIRDLYAYITECEHTAHGTLLDAGMAAWGALLAGVAGPIPSRVAGLMITLMPCRHVGTIDNPTTKA